MLLFICNAPTLRCKSQDFNTSHVTLYLLTSSHALFIMLFQYITCYSLSIDFFEHSDNLLEFQYISCYSLSCSIYRICNSDGMVSIHLMLLFIRPDHSSSSILLSFQYISCYSLSRLRRSGCTNGLSFNTSHVTLYLNFIPAYYLTSSFQYISCYSLSYCTTAPCTVDLPFQYISCYSLSGMVCSKCYSCSVSIHLMLLFVGSAIWR